MSRRRNSFFSNKTDKLTFKTFFKNIVELTKGSLQKKVLTRSLEESAGIEAEYVNPDKMLDAKGKDLRFYDTMMLDSAIKGAVELKKTLTLSTQWGVVDGGEEEKDKEIGQFVRDTIDGLEIPFDDVLDNTLDSMIYGFKVGEIIWNEIVDNGKYTWQKFKFMHSYLFDFKYNEYDDLESVAIGRMVGSSKNVSAEDFERKFVYMAYPYIKDGNYYGDSDLRELYVEWWQRFNIIRWRGVYLQGFSFRVPIITYDTKSVSTTELGDLDTMLDNWQDLMRVKIPGTRDQETNKLMGKFEIEWQDISSDKGAEQYTDTLDSLARDIRRKLLFPDKLGFTTDKGGALSQSDIFWKLFLKVIKKIHRRLEDVYNPKIKMLVDLNFGKQKNYPKLKFNEIDEGIEIEMLKLLLDAGVIDKREKWIRNKVDIPQLSEKEMGEIKEAKEQDVKEQQEAFARKQKEDEIANANNPKPDDKPNKNNVMPIKKEFKSTQGVNFDKIKDQLENNENDFIKDYDDIHKRQSERLIRLVKTKKIVENKDFKELNKLQMQKGELKKLFEVYYAKLYFQGRRDAIIEVKKDAKSMKMNLKLNGKYEFKLQDEVEWLDRSWIDRFLKEQGELGTLDKVDKKYLTDLKERAFFVTNETSNRILKEAKGIVQNGIRGNLTTAGVVGQLNDVLSEDRRRYALTIARTNSADAYNTGRMNTFLSPKLDDVVEAFQYQAILDTQTTEFCRSHDGQIIKKGDPELGNIVPPNHFNCRSILTAVLVGQDDIIDGNPEWGENVNANGETFNTNDPKVRKPAPGFGGNIVKRKPKAVDITPEPRIVDNTDDVPIFSNRKDAEEWAKDNLVDPGGKVSFKDLDMGVINSFNRTFKARIDEYGFKPENIRSRKLRSVFAQLDGTPIIRDENGMARREKFNFTISNYINNSKSRVDMMLKNLSNKGDIIKPDIDDLFNHEYMHLFDARITDDLIEKGLWDTSGGYDNYLSRQYYIAFQDKSPFANPDNTVNEANSLRRKKLRNIVGKYRSVNREETLAEDYRAYKKGLLSNDDDFNFIQEFYKNIEEEYRV
jgi:SPP1 gp7 family putative phage head morphogenesis protein